MAASDLGQINAELAQLMTDRLGIGGADFAGKVRRAGRLLPRHIRRAARFLVEAEKMSAHPKLIRLIDQKRTSEAAGLCRTYLKSVDPADRRWGIFLGRLSVVVFNLLLLAGLVIAVLVWRGYLGPGGTPGP